LRTGTTRLHALRCVLAAIMAGASISSAQTYPVHPVRWVLPGPAAGGVDVIARPIAQRLSESMSQQVIIDNRPGAGGLIAGQVVAGAAPDGYTVLLGTTGTHSIMPLLARKRPYDPAVDFAPVTMIATAPLLTAVHPSLPVRTVADLIRLAKTKPGELLYASNGTGTIHHLTIEMLSQAAGVRMLHVPYNGGTPAVIAAMSGQVHVVMTAIPTVLGQVRSARLRAVAVTGRTRSSAVPEIPTVAESGLPGFEAVQWYGMFVPARTPSKISQRLAAEIRKAVESAAATAALSLEGADVAVNGPRALSEFHQADIAKWQTVIRVAQIALD
jgi:tripartite-type tricarboxylate transporter receptor subunit TctC